MGQYHYIVNTTKKEYLDPHNFGQGLKLLEWSCSMGGVNTALAVLLSNSNNRGGGDLRSDHPIIGSWANNNIVVAGDYAEDGDAGESKGDNIFDLCSNGKYKDISFNVMEALLEDNYIRSSVKEEIEKDNWSFTSERIKKMKSLIKKVEGEMKEYAKTSLTNKKELVK
jgi:hypothetical protein